MTKGLKAAVGVAMIAVPLYAAMSASPEDQRPTPELRLPEPKPVTPPKPSGEVVSRGQLLYEIHCIACHESTLHVRQARRADSPKALESSVVRWSGQQGLGWGPEEVGEVVEYLNRRYYRFPPGK